MSSFSLSLSSLKRVVAVKKSKDYARRKQKENIRFLSLPLFSDRQSFNVGDDFLTFLRISQQGMRQHCQRIYPDAGPYGWGAEGFGKDV